MNVMLRFTWRQMKKQKRRTVITILGAIVAVAMITAVSSFKATFLDLFKRVELENSGGWHALLMGVSPEDRALLDADEKIEHHFILYDGDEETLAEKHGAFQTLHPMAVDDAGRDVMNVRLLAGAYPAAAGEIAVTENYYKRAGLSLGDTLRAVTAAGEEKTYTVTGLVSMTAIQGYAGGTAYALIPWQEDFDRQDESGSVYVTFHAPDKGIYDHLQALCEAMPGQQYYNTHSSLLVYMGVVGNDEIASILTGMEAVIMAIILLAAVTLIYNAFAISVTDRAAQFGMLASIGATKKQRLRSVLFEALLIGLFAIPFGLLFGYLGIGVTFRVVSGLLRDLMETSAQAELRLVIDPAATALSVLLALVTVLISAWIPALRAARVSPMEAIRKTQDIKLSGKKVKTSRLTRRLFGFEGELAAKNLKRHRKRYRITTLSLAMSLILFLSAYSFTHYMTSSFRMAQEGLDYNLVMTISPAWRLESGAVNYETLDRMKNQALSIPYVDSASAYTTYQERAAFLPAGQEAPCPLTRQARDVTGEEQPHIEVQFVALDDDTLRLYAQRVGADPGELTDPDAPAAILINGGSYARNGKYATLTVLDIQPGEELPVSFLVANQTQMDAPPTPRVEQIPFRLSAVTLECPPSLSLQMGRPMVALAVSERTARALMPDSHPYVQVLFQSSAPDQAEEALVELRDDYQATVAVQDYDRLVEESAYLFLNVMNVDTQQRSIRQLVTVMNIFVYGFITLLSLVGAANIVGTISTSLMLRKREFAMVKSVGMGPRAFDRMIRTESLFYGLKAVLWGLIGSFAALTAMYLILNRSFTISYFIPWLQILIGVAAIFLLVGVTMTYAVHKIRRDSIVEDLRLE